MAENPTTARAAVLDARYGRASNRKRRDRLLVVVAATLIAAVFTVWVVRSGLDNGQGNLGTQDIGHKIVDDSTVPTGTPVSCALQAQNDAHAIVGWKIVELPASADHSRRYTETVRTSQRAVTGLIYRCWLT